MYSYTLAQWVLFFLFYCFVGWCIETTFVSTRQHHFVNRGFLNGPVIPIYGSGAIAILFATLPVRTSPVLVFVLGMLAATVLEYLTGALMESTLKVRYWDYSQKRFNLHGYICLNTSLAWGALSIVLIFWVHRPVERVVLSLSAAASAWLAGALSAVFLADLAVSLKAALDLRRLLEQLEDRSRQAKEDLHTLQRRLEVYSTFKMEEWAGEGGPLQRRIEIMEQLAGRLEGSEPVQKLRADLAAWHAHLTEVRAELGHRMTWDKRALLRRNPGAISRHYAEQLKLLRQRLEERQKDRK